MNRVALIVCITGQDSRYLSEILLNKGYTVVGETRSSSFNTEQDRPGSTCTRATPKHACLHYRRYIGRGLGGRPAP